MNSNEVKEAIENTINSDGYKMILKKLEGFKESLQDTLGVYAGKKEYSATDDLVDKGRVSGIEYAIGLPSEIVTESEGEK